MNGKGGVQRAKRSEGGGQFEARVLGCISKSLRSGDS